MNNTKTWEVLLRLLKLHDCKCSLKAIFSNEMSDWESPLYEPVPSCVELSFFGPVAKCDVEWIDIDPIISIHVGRLVPNKTINVRDDVIKELDRFHIHYSETVGIIRIYFDR